MLLFFRGHLLRPPMKFKPLRPARLCPREAKCVTISGRFTFPREHCAPGALERQGEGSALARSLARPLGRQAPQLPTLPGRASAHAAA